MANNLSLEDIRLITEIINEKHDDLKEHIDTKIRLLKMTNQDNNKEIKEVKEMAAESVALGRKTNGRVSKLEDDVYGERDKHGDILKGKEGLIFELNKVTPWKWFYGNWRIPLAFFFVSLALFIKESRDGIVWLFNKIIF